MEKRLLLLAYLGCQDGWVERDRLADLFWPEVEQQRARTNLRQLLKRARAYPFTDGVVVDPRAMRWDVASDVAAFREAHGARAWAQAVALYRGDLLLGATVEGGSGMAQWLELERAGLQRQWREACLARADELANDGSPGEAASVLLRVLDGDILAEDVLQAYLRCALASGQREEALRRYDHFVTHIAEAFALEPLDATVALVEALRRGDVRTAPSTTRFVPADEAQHAAVPEASADATGTTLANLATGAAAVATAPVSTLPAAATPLIGRDIELAELAGMLADPACRLVTLTGPGGTGKTRLALEAALERVESFADGCHFVPLAGLDDPAALAAAIGDRLGVPLAGPASVDVQVCRYLRDKRALIVLDNMEHLIAGAGFVVELLEAAPDVRLLVTSREPLDFVQEAVFDVPGLGYPRTDEELGDGWHETNDAVRLFVQRARRQLPGFVMTDADRPAVLELCRLLHGSPLGLELAAAWVRRLRPAEIVEALRLDLDALTNVGDAGSGRHGSLRAVFDHSWALLAPEEQGALAAFSTFRGGASKDAALAVTGASLRSLLALVNKSLLLRDRSGRFEILEPLRQYAAERLRSRPRLHARAEGAHDRTMASFVAVQAGHLRGGPLQRDAFAAMDLEFDDVRVAWSRACDLGDADVLDAMCAGLGLYLERRSRFHEGVARFDEAHRSVRDRPTLRAALAVWSAAHHAGVGALETARELVEAVLRDDGVTESDGVRADAAFRLSVVERSLGTYDAARAHAAAALAHYEAMDDAWGRANALNALGTLAMITDDLEAARAHLTACAQLRADLGDAWGASIPLLNLGTVARYMGEIDEAERCYLASLELARANGNRVGVSFVLGTLAAIDAFRGAYAQAEERLLESLAIRRETGDRRLVANTLLNLATALTPVGAFTRVDEALDQAMAIFADIGDAQGAATALATRGARWLVEGNLDAAERDFKAALERETAIGHGHGANVARGGLARVALASGDAASALRLTREILAFAHRAGFTQLALEALTTYAESVALLADDDRAFDLARAVVEHTAASHELRRRARGVLGGLVDDAAVGEARHASAGRALDALVVSLLT